jgi:ankyrin repeat protein
MALLKAGADLKGRNKNGRTALMYAVEINDNPAVTAMLLRAGSDAKAKNSEGMTTLDYAQNNVKLKGTDAFRQLEESSR